jgi:hypothetical protein
VDGLVVRQKIKMNAAHISVGAISAGIVLGVGIMALHLWSFHHQPRSKRGPYFLIAAILVSGTLFIPVDDGGGHTGTIRLWAAYYFLATPGFYDSHVRDITIDRLVFTIPLIQHFTCVLLASLAVRRYNEAEQAETRNPR